MGTALRCIAGLLALAALGADVGAAPPPSPAGVARAFNAALSTRRLDEALALTASGAVQFNLEPAHSFAPGTGSALASDLATHWRTVGPVLFASHETYRREVVAETTHVDGRLAVVWARLRTTSKLRGSPATLSEFSETYLLHLEPGGWRIAGIANSRRAR